MPSRSQRGFCFMYSKVKVKRLVLVIFLISITAIFMMYRTADAGSYIQINFNTIIDDTVAEHGDEWITVQNHRLGRVMARALSSKSKAGRVNMSNFSVIKYVDDNSSRLYSLSANGTIIPEVRLEVDRPHNGPVQHIVFTLKDVIIISVLHAGKSKGKNLERVNMRYTIGRYKVFPVEKP